MGMRKEATFCTNSRDPFSLWISNFKLPAESWKRSCSLPPRAGKKAATGGKMGIGKGLERWNPLWHPDHVLLHITGYQSTSKMEVTASSAIRSIYPMCPQTWEESRLRKLKFSSAIQIDKPSLQLWLKSLAYLQQVRADFFHARKHKENSATVLLSMFLDKYLSQLSLSLTLVLPNYRCKSKGPRGNGHFFS